MMKTKQVREQADAVLHGGAGVPLQHPGNAPVLRLRGIYKRFGSVQALRGVDLSIAGHEVHAIVGENGAGKSTLIAIAAGVLAASEGQVLVDEVDVARPDPVVMRRAGVAVAYQHPALPSHLTVLECMRLAAPDSLCGKDAVAKAAAILARVCSAAISVQPHQSIAGLTLAQRHAVEIARALASKPRVLILDEPTEPFQEAEVARLFELIRALKAEGCAVIYISHRLHEVQQVADRISVLRDGELIDTRPAGAFTHDDIIESIVGCPLGSVFPAKMSGSGSGAALLSVRGLSGEGYAGVDLDVHAGEIVGLAGVEGQGQREFLRALAGMCPIAAGELAVNGCSVAAGGRAAHQRAGIGFVPGDRHQEGIFASISVGQNLALGKLERLGRGGMVDGRRVTEDAAAVVNQLSIKTATLDTPVSALSGGNQQKVLIGRELTAHPSVLLIDEPTVGVDIGSKSEIYHQLRTQAASGVALVISASDGVEIEGLCDRVLVFSRGRVVAELAGPDVTDNNITAANLQSTERRDAAHSQRSLHRSRGGRLLTGGYLPVPVLGGLVAAIAACTTFVNGDFATAYNAGLVLTFLAGLCFVAFAQQCVMMLGEIDFSAGPLAGLVVVLASYWLPADAGGFELALGIAAILALCGVVGVLQGLAVTLFRLPAIVVTLGTFFGFQGIALLLRPLPTGMISDKLLATLGFQVGTIPLAAILTLLGAAGLEWILFSTHFGRAVRAAGSDRAAAHKLGVRRTLLGPLVFGLGGVLTAIGGLILAAEVGIGSATVGANYTLMSITAVVLGGASITGGWGSFVCTLFGAMLVQATFSATAFLGVGAEWQYWMVGAVTLAAASLYKLARGR